jgi:hypothetical protein
MDGERPTTSNHRHRRLAAGMGPIYGCSNCDWSERPLGGQLCEAANLWNAQLLFELQNCRPFPLAVSSVASPKIPYLRWRSSLLLGERLTASIGASAADLPMCSSLIPQVAV